MVLLHGEPPEWCVDHVQDFSFLFAGLSKKEVDKWNVSDVSQWNVSGGKWFQYIFGSSRYVTFWVWNQSLISIPRNSSSYLFNQSFANGISNWDVSGSTDFSGMFYKASEFNSDISTWDVARGTNFNSMFRGASRFESDVSAWNVSRGTDFSGMFESAHYFNSDISAWDVSSGTNFRQMFSWAFAFNSS